MKTQFRKIFRLKTLWKWNITLFSKTLHFKLTKEVDSKFLRELNFIKPEIGSLFGVRFVQTSSKVKVTDTLPKKEIRALVKQLLEPTQIIKKTLRGGKIKFVSPEEFEELKQEDMFISLSMAMLPGVWDINNFAENEVGINGRTFERCILKTK